MFSRLRFSSCSGGNYIEGAEVIKAQFPAVADLIEKAEAIQASSGLRGTFRATLRSLVEGNTGYWGTNQGPDTEVRGIGCVDFAFTVPHLTVGAKYLEGSGVQLTPITRSRVGDSIVLEEKMIQLAQQHGFHLNPEVLRAVIVTPPPTTIGYQALVKLDVITKDLFDQLRAQQL